MCPVSTQYDPKDRHSLLVHPNGSIDAFDGLGAVVELMGLRIWREEGTFEGQHSAPTGPAALRGRESLGALVIFDKWSSFGVPTHALEHRAIPIHLALQVRTKGVGLDVARMFHDEIKHSLSRRLSFLFAQINVQAHLFTCW